MPLNVKGDAGHPGWQGGGQEKISWKNGGPLRRRCKRGCRPKKVFYVFLDLQTCRYCFKYVLQYTAELDSFPESTFGE
jgi:hypothetical protein